MNLAIIDIILLVVVGIMAIRGLFRGMLKELFSFGALVLGLLASFAFYRTLGRLLAEQFSSNSWYEHLSFFIIFIIVFALLKMIEQSLLKIIQNGAASHVDKGLGFVIGSFEGVVLCSVFLYFMEIQPFFKVDKFLEGSSLIPLFSKIFPYLESTGSAVMNTFN